MPFASIRKRRSRLFGSRLDPDDLLPTPLVAATARSPPPARKARKPWTNPFPFTFRSLRRSVSGIFDSFRPRSITRLDMDGTCEPNHRTATPPPPAMVGSEALHVSRARRLLQSTSGNEQLVPQRKRSVRFEGFSQFELDGQMSDNQVTTPEPKRRSRGSHSTSKSLEALAAKLKLDTATSTVVRRSSSKKKPNVPYIHTNFDGMNGSAREAEETPAPSFSSSSSPSSRSANPGWSPDSGTASTAATSWTTSPKSSGSRNKRATPEDCQKDSKSGGTGEENILPVIEEDSGRFLLIPVQETLVNIEPSVTTVENAAAAKCALETHFYDLMMEPHSPRSIRRKKFEKKLNEMCMPHDERVLAWQQWNTSESDHLRQMRVLKSTALQRHEVKGISIAGFDSIRVLGKGSFGVVRLVTEHTPNANDEQTSSENDEVRETINKMERNFSHSDGTAKRNLPQGKPLHDVFAMKVIRKSEMLRACQEGHLRAERDFLVASEGSRWVVPLIASFQDNTNLYLVMEYMIGGDFLGLLLREDVLEEEVARWYVAEMILCIEEAHKMKWIHRDIKPDNFLISASGHLKISDFGLAFNGHWAHSQSYYNSQRESLLDKIGIKITGDDQDVIDEQEMQEEAAKSPQRSPRSKADVEESAHREGLLNWRNRLERRKLARSVVGTSQYMAPEVIMGQPYDGRCD
ncbi:hypothetical protein AC579_4194 [Pseudocercospora musae]|uniref:non-specific serine/threonine protein kinase n=1 Tax=Pseudocercospora musae TaxID=113226 RepID=A0A139IGU8_9PEZI|nr:hypothetical protein AC579_4194 [Pseudocercospora musae]